MEIAGYVHDDLRHVGLSESSASVGCVLNDTIIPIDIEMPMQEKYDS